MHRLVMRSKKCRSRCRSGEDESSVREAADPLRVSDRTGILTVENSLVKARFSTVFGKLLSFGTEDRAYLTELAEDECLSCYHR